MRVSTNMMYRRGVRSLQNANERLDTANQQLTTGYKFSSAGDDPVGMSQAQSLSTKIGLYNQYNNNAGLLNSSLSLEETALNSVNTSLSRAYTLMQQANSGALSSTDRASIATSLSEIQKQLLDLMNSKNADGEYIFGGNQSQTTPFTLGSNGKYIFQGDTGQRQIQVAPSVTIPSNDSGLALFESVATQRTASTTSTPVSDLSIGITDQSQYDTFFQNNYSFATPAKNSYQVSITTDVSGNPKYDILDSTNTSVQSGSYQVGTAISFNGLSLTTNMATGSSATFQLDAPKNDNILNTLSKAIATLNNPAISGSTITDLAAEVETHLTNAMNVVNTKLGEIGGRMNTLDDVISSNSSLSSIATEAKANVSEVDIYAAISKVSQEQNSLTVAQQAYTKISKASLFDYL
ncbi:flagellar hook-associated protein FlgL [uncultured Tolumonas sp.]|uniref:flagellar hook-associated protein FlgL n=1 Tax=uncultured Tolumonas sp. TaxID=263765 RepID=UPI002A0A5211|nr:flagellar hook-associated protein FlgL [uncultured Tolumonas sp.]